jgi:hypothetical protein
MSGSVAAGAVGKAMAQVEDAISSGGLWKQLTAITLLRLTPVVGAGVIALGLTAGARRNQDGRQQHAQATAFGREGGRGRHLA